MQQLICWMNAKENQRDVQFSYAWIRIFPQKFTYAHNTRTRTVTIKRI
jgi:hypothetical protein